MMMMMMMMMMMIMMIFDNDNNNSFIYPRQVLKRLGCSDLNLLVFYSHQRNMFN